MPYETIETSREGSVAVLTLNRPHVLNAFNRMLMRELSDAVAAANAEPDVLAIVVHGQGRAFSAGFDMKESAARTHSGTEAWRQTLQEDFDFIFQFWSSPKPTIAAVHGFCLAGAFELALACDVTVAAEGTRFGEPEVRFGSGIICLLLPWVAGPKAAKELLLTGNDRLDADRALELGIVNQVVPAGAELSRALEIARDICAAAPLSVMLTKQAINRSFQTMGLEAALQTALDLDVHIESSGGPERVEFNRLRSEEGLQAALAWRDSRFESRAPR